MMEAHESKSTPAALERHYTVAEVAELWGLGETKVRELFRAEPGVLRGQATGHS